MAQKSPASIVIDMVLDYQDCTMICPQYEHQETKPFDFDRSKVPRKEGNELKLEKTISEIMQEKHQKQLAEALSDTSPIMYVDCSAKGEDDVMFAIMHAVMNKYPGRESEEMAIKSIVQRSMINDEMKQVSSEDYKAFMTTYKQEFQKFLQSFDDRENKEEVLNSVYKFETDVPLNAIGKILQANKWSAYVYLDHVSDLTVEEQQSINLLLYARGAIGRDGKVFLKINDGLASRKTWSTASWHRVQSTHDYSETNIKEKDL